MHAVSTGMNRRAWRVENFPCSLNAVHAKWHPRVLIVLGEKAIFKTITTSIIGLALAGSALASDVTYRKDIRPVWEAKCAECHGASSPYLGEFLENTDKFKEMNKGPRMDTYADLIIFVGWPDTGAIMRRLDDGKNTKDGKPGSMYQYLGANPEERRKNFDLFKAWVGEEAWVHKRWDAKGDMPGVTKEELSKMKVKY